MEDSSSTRSLFVASTYVHTNHKQTLFGQNRNANSLLPQVVRIWGVSLYKCITCNMYIIFRPTNNSLIFQNKQGSDSQRSFGVGMIAECMSYAGSNLQTFSTQLVDLLTSLATDNNKEVRNNAVFALGEFVYHGRDIVFPYPFNLNKSEEWLISILSFG